MTDLLIGSRRSGPRRRMRTLVGLAFVCALVGAVAYAIYSRVVSYAVASGEAPAGPPVLGDGAELVLGDGPATLSFRGQVALLRLDGDAHAVGAQHGRLLAEAVAEVAASLAPAIAATTPSDGFFGETTHPLRLRWRWRLVDDGIPGHQLVEIAGLVRGAGAGGAELDYEAAVRRSAALDVGVPASSSPGSRLHAMSRALSFVTSVRAPAGDRLLVGRSFSLVGAADGGRAAARTPTLVTVRGDGIIPFAHVAWPGQVGVVTGVNAEGIAIFVHPVRTDDVQLTRDGQPVALIARELLENARSLQEAVSVLEAARPLGAAAFVVVDGAEQSWAVVERTPSTTEVRRAPSPPVVGDLLGGLATTDDALVDRARRTRPIEARVARAAELLRNGVADPAAAAAVLRDRAGVGGARLPAGHRGAVADPDATHAVLVDPAAMVIWVGEGPGAAGRMRAFDLRYLLRESGSRPAPPPDIPADLEVQEEARTVLAARALVREARAAAAGGDLRAAREHSHRALAHAPDLPEALLVAGELARSAGDDEAALAHFRRYLDVGPDHLGAQVQVEALVGPAN